MWRPSWWQAMWNTYPLWVQLLAGLVCLAAGVGLLALGLSLWDRGQHVAALAVGVIFVIVLGVISPGEGDG